MAGRFASAGSAGEAGDVGAVTSNDIDDSLLACPTSNCVPSCSTALHRSCLEA